MGESPPPVRAKPCPADSATQDRIFVYLDAWRGHQFDAKWEALYPMYGPQTFISDADLRIIAKHAHKIVNISDLKQITRIIYWRVLGEDLLKAVHEAWVTETGKPVPHLIDDPDDKERAATVAEVQKHASTTSVARHSLKEEAQENRERFRRGGRRQQMCMFLVFPSMEISPAAEAVLPTRTDTTHTVGPINNMH